MGWSQQLYLAVLSLRSQRAIRGGHGSGVVGVVSEPKIRHLEVTASGCSDWFQSPGTRQDGPRPACTERRGRSPGPNSGLGPFRGNGQHGKRGPGQRDGEETKTRQ